MIRLSLLYMIASIATGCATMSAKECATADWRAIGYEDGAAGRAVSAVSDRRAACARKAGAVLDMKSYLEGRSDGLSEYCTLSNAYAIGERGGSYAGVCSDDLESGFLAAFQSGRFHFHLQREVTSIDKEIRQTQYDLRALERNLAATEVDLVTPGLSVSDRISLIAEFKQLSQSRRAILVGLDSLYEERAAANAELSAYRMEWAAGSLSPGATPITNANFE